MLSYKALYGVLALYAILTLIFKNPILYPDSQSYIKAFHTILEGYVSPSRTPLYPLFLGSCISLFGETITAFRMVMVMQWILCFCGIFYFRLAASQVLPNRRHVFWTTIFYAFTPPVTYYNVMILSEALAVPLCIFFTYVVLRFIKKPTFGRICLIFFWLMLMLSTRPVFVYMMVLLPILMIWMRRSIGRSFNRILLTGGGLWVVLAGLLMGYSSLNRHQHGFGGLSVVTRINNYHLLRCADLIHADSTCNPAILKIFRSNGLPHEELKPTAVDYAYYAHAINEEENTVRTQVGDSLFCAYIDSMMFAAPAEVAGVMYARFSEEAQRYPVFYSFIPVKGYRNLPLVPSLGAIELWLLIIAVLLMVAKHKYKYSLLPQWWLWAVSAAQLCCVLIGAMNDYGRLFFPAYPSLLILSVSILSGLSWNASSMVGNDE